VVLGFVHFAKDVSEQDMSDARKMLHEVAEGIKDSLRLAGWLLACVVEVIAAFVNHRDHKPG
jgi:hypothetical protein